MTIGTVLIAIRDARAPWLTSTHKLVLVMLTARLPTIRPPQTQVADDAGLDRRTIVRVLADLQGHGLVRYDGGKRGRAHVYRLRPKAIRALIPAPHPHEIDDHTSAPEMRSTITPGVIHDHTHMRSTITPRGKEESTKRQTPTPARTPARPVPAGAPPGEVTEGEVSPVGRVLAAYADGYLRARGVDPTINGHATRAATDLIAAVGIDGALTRIAHAAVDPWWRDHGTLDDIARRPDRYATAPRPGPAKTSPHMQPLAPRRESQLE